MADKTAFLELTKPLGTENYDIEVFNDNADIIDAAVKVLYDERLDEDIDETVRCDELAAFIADLPKNLGGHRVKITVSADSGVVGEELKIWGFYNGRFTLAGPISTDHEVKIGPDPDEDMTTLPYRQTEIELLTCLMASATAAAGFQLVISGTTVSFWNGLQVGAYHKTGIVLKNGGKLYDADGGGALAVTASSNDYVGIEVGRDSKVYAPILTISDTTKLVYCHDGGEVFGRISAAGISPLGIKTERGGKVTSEYAMIPIEWLPHDATKNLLPIMKVDPSAAGGLYYVWEQELMGEVKRATIAIVGIRDGWIFAYVTDGAIPAAADECFISADDDAPDKTGPWFNSAHATSGYYTSENIACW